SRSSHTTHVERTECKLCTRLTDRLRSDDTNRITLLGHDARGKVLTIALHATSALAFASQYRTYLNRINSCFLYLLRDLTCNLFATGDDQVLAHRIVHIVQRSTTFNPVRQRFNDVFIIFQRVCSNTTQCSAIFFSYHHILCNVNETTCEVTGIGSLKGRIRKTFTRTVGRDEVIQYVQSTLEVGKDRVFNDLRAA